MLQDNNLIAVSSRGAGLARPEAARPENLWLHNFISPNTKAAYRQAVLSFAQFAGLTGPDDLRRVDRGMVLAWRGHMEAIGFAPRTIRARLAALSSLFGELCEAQLIGLNPCHGLKRPSVNDRQVESVLLTKAQARRLLAAPDPGTLAGKRDLAILCVLLYTGARISEAAGLKVCDLFEDAGFWVLRYRIKGGKTIRNPLSSQLLYWLRQWLEAAGHGLEDDSPLFLPVKPFGPRGGTCGGCKFSASSTNTPAWPNCPPRPRPTPVGQPLPATPWTPGCPSNWCRRPWATPASPPPASTARNPPPTKKRLPYVFIINLKLCPDSGMKSTQPAASNCGNPAAYWPAPSPRAGRPCAPCACGPAGKTARVCTGGNSAGCILRGSGGYCGFGCKVMRLFAGIKSCRARPSRDNFRTNSNNE